MSSRILVSRWNPLLLLASSWCLASAQPALAGRPEPASSATIPSPELPHAGAGDGVLLAAANSSKSGELVAEQDLTQVAPAPAPAAAPSTNVTINLIQRLVQRGVLGQADATDLIKQAEADAMVARAQTLAVEQVAAAQAAVPPEPDPYGGDDALKVTYVPENVRAQMREEIKQDVMAKAREENWAAPRTLPEWTTRIRLFGDLRVRYEGAFFPDGNDDSGAFPNFNAINTGAPFDVAGSQFSPQLNVDQNRNRIRLRVRFGLEADLGNGFSAGLRIGTGESNTPISTNQTLGLANQGQGGNFSKYAIWLDRGFLRYQTGPSPDRTLSFTVGRFDNPFFNTSEIVWDEDVGFDGAALQARYEVRPGLTPFLNTGAFPVFNTDFNYSSNQSVKFKSQDKWLYGGQFGLDLRARKDINLKLAVAYYHFDNVEGQLSDPFIPLSKDDAGNTDNTRPTFAQNGNSYRPLRRIIASPLNNYGTTNQYQYFGLATPFHELVVSTRLDLTHWEPFQISIFGEWAKNLAYDGGAINAIAINNRGANGLGGIGKYEGGNTASIAGLKIGTAALQKAGDWQIGLSYRYVESDAVVDGLCDSDFGLGGTNLKGYTIFGNVAISPRVSLGMRWMSADEIAGPPLKVDVLEFSYSGKF